MLENREMSGGGGGGVGTGGRQQHTARDRESSAVRNTGIISVQNCGKWKILCIRQVSIELHHKDKSICSVW